LLLLHLQATRQNANVSDAAPPVAWTHLPLSAAAQG